MLPRARRFTKADFSNRPARRQSFPFGTIAVFAGPPGAAVVVSKKVAKSAVARNRLRRRAYAILRPELASGALSRRVAVFLNRKGAEARFADFKSELMRALRDC